MTRKAVQAAAPGGADMTPEQLNRMLETGLNQAKSGQGADLDAAFEGIFRELSE